MLFLEYPPCSTCQKARRWLEKKGITFEARHIKNENPTEQELRLWHEKSGLELKRFFNTSGLMYRSLELKEKLPGMSYEQQLQLLSSDGMLVKRPLLIMEDKVLVGFKESQWEEAMK